MGCRAVLIKGGHAQGAESIDYLFEANRTLKLAAPPHRHPKHPRHGLLAVIGDCGGPGERRGPGDRRPQRKAWISAAISAADRFSVGHGHGPIHHFHKFY